MRSVLSFFSRAKGVVRFDDELWFQVDVGHVAARQTAIDLAMLLDSDCMDWELDVLQLVWPHGMMIGDIHCIWSGQTTQPFVVPF